MTAKVKDDKNRWRNKLISFRMSPEEATQLNSLVELSGLSKQDYIISRLSSRDVAVQSNPRVYKALRRYMVDIFEQLKQIEPNSEILEILKVIAITLNGFKEDRKEGK